MTGDPCQSGFEAAAVFVAQQADGPERVLTQHRRRPDGCCAGCTGTPTPWPCTAAAIATAAARLASRTPPAEPS